MRDDVKTYSDHGYRYPTMVRHDGKVIALAMDEHRRIRYTVLDLASATASNPLDAAGWSANPTELMFADEIAHVGYGVADQTRLPVVKLGTTSPVAAGVVVRDDETDRFLSSTARLTAAVPFQVLSDGRYLYVLRQAIADPTAPTLDAAHATIADANAGATDIAAARDLLIDHEQMLYVLDDVGRPVLDLNGRPVPLVGGTLLVDRFVLVGDELQPKLEVRFKRSRSKSRPQSSKDSLGAADLEGRPFVEPTQELRFIPGLSGGRFSALLVPTQVADVFRWQVFAVHAADGPIWSYNIERSDDGLFNTLGTQAYTCVDHPDTYALAAGTCPAPSLDDPTQVCAKRLVPLVPTAGAAGTALSFDGRGAGVALTPGAAIGSSFTMEAWVDVDSTASNGDRSLFGAPGADQAHTGPSVWIAGGTKIGVGFGDGTAWHQSVSADLLVPGWHHLGITFDGTVLQVYLDGSLAFGSADLDGIVPVATPVTEIAGAPAGFAGTLDEVRIWEVARSAASLRAGMHRRLTGLEPGLATYLRLDEGRGTAVVDLAGRGTGAVTGATWVTSDAPVADSVGLTRSTVGFDRHTVTGGLNAALYYEQENVASGYSATPKPTKQAARVMLVAAVVSSAGQPAIAVLDHGVSADGTLARITTDVVLTDLAPPQTAGASPNALLDQLASLESERSGLDARVSALTAAVNDLGTTVGQLNGLLAGATTPVSFTGELARLNPSVVALLAHEQHVHDLQYGGGDIERRLRQQLIDASNAQIVTDKAPLQAAQPGLQADFDVARADLTQTQARLAAVEASLADIERAVDADVVLPMPLLHVDAAGLTVCGGALGFVSTGDTPVLFDSALGRLALYVRDAHDQFMVAYYDTFTGRTVWTVPAAAGVMAFVARSTDGAFDHLAITVDAEPVHAGQSTCTVTVSLPDGPVPITETWNDLPTDAEQLAAIINGRPPAPVFVGALAQSVDRKVDRLDLAVGTPVPLPAGAIVAVGGELAAVVTPVARNATSIPITPMALTKPAGTAIFKVAYDYAASATTTATGASLVAGSRLVGVDARGAEGAVATGSASSLGSTAAARWFADPAGTTLDFDGRHVAAGVLARTALTFDGAHDGVTLAPSPTLSITGQITLESWIRPTATDGFRDILAHGYTLTPAAEVYLRISNGEYQVGSWDGGDHFAAASVPAGDLGAWVHLAGTYDGNSWRLYRNGILLASHADPNGAVAVGQAWGIGVAGNATERFFAGDLDDVRIWNVARNPQQISEAMGSRLGGTEAGLVAYLYASGGRLQDRSATATAPTVVGSPRPATSPPRLAELDGFDVPADLTIEAWVNPTQTSDVGRVVQHQSDVSNYTLGLHLGRSALHFNGTTDSAVIAAAPELDITGPITLEAWINADKTDGLRDVFGHGYVSNPAGEVILRIQDGNYYVGAFDGHDHGVAAPMPATDRKTWVHLAGVYDGSAWRLYRNGVLVASAADPVGAVPVAGDWSIGAAAQTNDRFFAGAIDEVRLWRTARSAAQINADMNRRLDGAEPGLAGLWRAAGTTMRDVTANHHDATTRGAPTAVPGALSAYTIVATAGNHTVETSTQILSGEWTHVAASYQQAYGIHVAGSGAYLDAGASMTLDITRDLTIEIGVALDDLVGPHGLISRGVLGDGSHDDVPYSMYVGTGGTVNFSFEDTDHAVHTVTSPPVLTAGTFHRIAVTRKRNIDVAAPTPAHGSTGAVVSSWDDITLHVDGAVVLSSRYSGKDPGSTRAATTIGRAYGTGGVEIPLRGSLAEVRLWNTARAATDVGAVLHGNEIGLIGWWRLDDGTGNVATDAKGSNDAVLRGAVSWVKSPDPTSSSFTVYVNGTAVPTLPVAAGTYQASEPQFTIGALGNTTVSERYRGQLEEVRLWRVVRTVEEIHDNLFRRLTGDQQDLVAYYTLDAEPGGTMSDHSPRGNDLIVSAGTYILSTAPIGEDAPQIRNALVGTPTAFNTSIHSAPSVSEYADLEVDADNMAAGVFKRCYGYIDATGAWNLITGFKVGDMTTEWVGQVQFAPQLMGFIEGAPPVPSENLTVQDDYTNASSVALNEAATTTYTYANSRDSGFNASFEAGASFGDKSQTFVGLIEIEAPLGIGVGEVELTSVEEANVSGGVKSTFETALSWLNTSSTGTGSTTTRLSTLGLNGFKETSPAHPSIGTRFVPDNTGFALVQSETADVFALRLVHTGALIAYQMRPNPDIPKDWNILTFPINAAYTKQGTLDGKVGLETDTAYPQALAYSNDISYFKPVEAYAIKEQITRDAQALATRYSQFGVDPNMFSGGASATLPPPVHHDLVNTYVWTAAGGQFAETQQSLDSYDETVGGAYAFQGLAGGNISVDVSVLTIDATFDLQAMFGGHLELSVQKEANSQVSFGVTSTCNTEQNISIVDPTGSRVLQPGKVDAYRYMTFYLSPKTDHHDLFFNQVVDPIWLTQSNDPAAAALRQARQDAKRPAAWRILHRVTYVSRTLGPVATAQATPLEQALQTLDIQSNYELIKTLEPFVRDKAARYVDFAAAVRRAVITYLPDLQPHLDQILAYLVLYYGVGDAPQLAAS